MTLQIGPIVEIGFIDKRRSDGQTTTSPVGTPANYASMSALDTRLAALGYTTSQLNIMTLNDKIFAVRSADDAAGI